jgi:2-polyprenyl-3-methyl-5-hydroxy-6-metoxy-1,4-benzoquinol methylase
MSENQYTSPSATQNIQFLPKILSLLPPAPARVLEVGCGNGYLASHLFRMGYDVTALDTSKSGIAVARATHSEINFYVASAYDDLCRFVPDCDVVLSVEVIEHLADPRRFLENAFITLKPGGCIILTTPYHGYFKNLALSLTNRWDAHFGVHWLGGHIKFFSEHSLSAMLRAVGFTDIRFTNAGRVPYLWKSMVCWAKKDCLGLPQQELL